MLNYKPEKIFYSVNTTNLFQLKIYQSLKSFPQRITKKLNLTYQLDPKTYDKITNDCLNYKALLSQVQSNCVLTANPFLPQLVQSQA